MKKTIFKKLNSNQLWAYIAILVITIVIYIYVFNNECINNIFSVKEGLSFSFKPFKHALEEEGITVDNKNHVLIYNGKKLSYINHMNNNDMRAIANDKESMYKVLKENNILAPVNYRWNFMLSNSENLQNLHKVLKPPFVVKPTDGIQGQHVYIGIENDNKLLEKINTIIQSNKHKGVVVEELLVGKTYRVLVIDNNIVDVVNQGLPSVTGDGKTSLQNLIDKYNEYQRENGMHRVNKIDMDYIKQQGIDNMDAIIPAGMVITISRIGNGHNGSQKTRIPLSSIPASNLNIFKKVHKISGLRISGTDYISYDITNNKYPVYVLDVNPGPGMGTHYNGYSKHDKDIFIKNIARHIKNMFSN